MIVLFYRYVPDTDAHEPVDAAPRARRADDES